ncbi:hypothetical protein SRAA_0591 [Serpentinimonas raichei]|jgi:hypothetical protein|uniref:Transmembrane protein n=1 Tax=Serpentinimonas raichei TaxID=1458425 RepID=A0A060NHZ2_9BURK|nr:hypothetical protein SRAA_0591 [Serpentinimonas raichei]
MLFLYVIVIAWLYVVVLMAASVATSPTGTLFAAIMTLFFYGLLPLALMVYLMTGPLRRKAQQEAEAASKPAEASAGPTPPSSPESNSDSGLASDAGRHAPAAAEPSPIAPMRKEP